MGAVKGGWLWKLGGGAALFPLVVLFLLQFLDQATQYAFNVLVPNVRDAFHLSNAEILAITALAAAAGFLGTVPVAWLADRRARVPIALVGAALSAVFSIALGLAPTTALLAVALCGVFVGQAVIFPTHNSLLADYFPVAVRPRVYSTHRAGFALGSAAGVLIGAGLTAAFSWRVPFVALSIPIFVLVAIGVWLREPQRGRHEEHALLDDSGEATRGAAAQPDGTTAVPTPAGSADAPSPVESPPSFGEAWRMVWKVGVLRRIFFALPFLAAAIAGFASIASVQYQETFHLDAVQRSFLVAPVQVFVVGGLVVGAVVGTRMARRGLRMVFRMLAAAAASASAFAVLFALAPSVVVAFFADAGIEASLAIVTPGVLAALSLAIPARSRSVGFSIGALFVLPGLAVLPLVGAIGDTVGFRYGILMLVPIFLLGGLILASAGSFIDADVRNVWISMHARSEMLAARVQGELPLLAVRSLDVGYEGVSVVRGVDLEIAEGEIVGLLGTNGAGKSTLLRAIGGITEADAGAVIFNGRDITHTPPDEIARMGVSQMPGGAGVFPTLTVEENLRAAAWQERHQRREAEARVTEALAQFDVLAARRGDRAGELSGGQQQMLAIAMALLTAPALLLIDELTLGLAPIVARELLASVRSLRAGGTAVLLVEQSVDVAVSLCERVYVMDSGSVRFSGSAEEVRAHPELLWSIYLHRAAAGMSCEPVPAEEPQRHPASPKELATAGAQTPALSVSEVSVSFGGINALEDVSLAAQPGEVIGIIGPNGAGKTTLVDVISGFTRPQHGQVFLHGTNITSMSAAGRSRRGLGRSFQDSRLFSGLTVRETLAVALERFIDVGDPLNAAIRAPTMVRTEEAVAARVDELIDLFGLERFADKFVSELSTGTRRLVDLAAVVAHAPKVVLLDEPSSGVAQREVEAMAGLLRRVQLRLDASLVVVEHDVAFIGGLADRLVTLDRGGVLAEGEPSDVLVRPEVVEAFLGNDPLIRSRGAELPRQEAKKPQGVRT